MPRKVKLDDQYLVAYPSCFPGGAIPLLSDEECAARGIEPGRFPPRETLTQQQRDAADRLAEILIPVAYTEALRVILAELECEPIDLKRPDIELEREAATRAMQLVETGKWKQHDTTIHVPPSWIRQILEYFAQGDLSIVNPAAVDRQRKAHKRGKAAKTPSRKRRSQSAIPPF